MSFMTEGLLTDKVQKAINLACLLHSGQSCDAEQGLPCLDHLISVTLIVSSYVNNDEDMLAAAMMHNSVEFVNGYKYEDLIDGFGCKVADIVKTVSEFRHEQYKAADWRVRKEAFLRQLADAGRQAAIVCAADQIHHLAMMIEYYRIKDKAQWKLLYEPIEDELWFYEQVVMILKKKRLGAIVRQLDQILTDFKISVIL